MASERDQVDEIKSKVDIVEVIGSRVNLKKAGRHFKGLCPFHSEKTPSFIVSPERQSFKCFGCQKGGDVLTFLQDFDGYSFLEALEMLAKKVGITLTTYRPTTEDVQRKRVLEILSLADEYFHYLLTKHQVGEIAREYLRSRGVTNESIKKFHLGYAPESWRSVSEFLVKKKKYEPRELEMAGLTLSTSSGFYDRFRGRVIFPLRDHKGVVVGFSGRTLSTDVKEAKYINSPETLVYHKSRMLYGLWENREAIRKADRIVLVEGELDVIPSVQANVGEVVAIKGSAFTEEQAQIISRYTRNIVMSLDADLAGQEAIKRAVIIAEKLDLSIRVVQIKGGKDPGDVASTNPRAWREMTEQAVLYWDFLIEAAEAKIDAKTGEGTEAISREVIPALCLISNMVMRAHYVTRLAKGLAVPEESIYAEMERVTKKKELTQLKETVNKIEQGVNRRGEEVLLHLLALALQNYPTLKEQIQQIELAWVGQTAGGKILAKLKGYQAKTWKIAEFGLTLPPELQETLDVAYLRDLTGVKEVTKEWEGAVREIEEQYIREKLKKITEGIAKAEKDEKGEMGKWQSEFEQYSRRLTELSR